VTAVAVLAVPMAGIIWFICQLRYKQQIATSKDRVELAYERLGDAEEKIVKAKEEKTALHTTVKELNAQIEKLKKRKAQLPRGVAVYRRSSSYVVRNGLKSGKQARRGSRSFVHWRQAPVHVDEEIDLRADGVANRACDFHGAPDVIFRDVGPPGARDGIKFQRGESAFEHRFRAASIVLGQLHLVASAVRIDADARTAGTARRL
jgi:hypothetical protein